MHKRDKHLSTSEKGISCIEYRVGDRVLSITEEGRHCNSVCGQEKSGESGKAFWKKKHTGTSLGWSWLVCTNFLMIVPTELPSFSSLPLTRSRSTLCHHPKGPAWLRLHSQRGSHCSGAVCAAWWVLGPCYLQCTVLTKPPCMWQCHRTWRTCVCFLWRPGHPGAWMIHSRTGSPGAPGEVSTMLSFQAEFLGITLQACFPCWKCENGRIAFRSSGRCLIALQGSSSSWVGRCRGEIEDPLSSFSPSHDLAPCTNGHCAAAVHSWDRHTGLNVFADILTLSNKWPKDVCWTVRGRKECL